MSDLIEPANDRCTCMEVYGEDPCCVLHGITTSWALLHMSAEEWQSAAVSAADEITALRERVAVLTEHIREQCEHCRVRRQDGIEMGAVVWRLALEDIIRENAAILAKQEAGP